MSITNSDLVTAALRELSVLDETQTASAEQFNDTIRKLNQLMETWEETEIRLEYFAQSVSSDSCPIPKYAEIGVIASLAVLCAPTYGAQVSPSLATAAQLGYATILRKAVQENLQPATMTNRSRSSAWGFPWNINNGP